MIQQESAPSASNGAGVAGMESASPGFEGEFGLNFVYSCIDTHIHAFRCVCIDQFCCFIHAICARIDFSVCYIRIYTFVFVCSSIYRFIYFFML